MTQIQSGLFSNCSKLTSVNIPSTVTLIGTTAFQNCYKLASIELPDGLLSISNSAFASCNSLSYIIIPASVTTIQDNSISSLINILVMKGADTTGFASGWNGESNGTTNNVVFNVVETFVSDGISYALVDDGTNKIAYIYDFDQTLTTFEPLEVVDEYLVESNVMLITLIKNRVKNKQGLTRIVIPDGVTTLPAQFSYWFANCRTVEYIKLPAGLTDIGEYCFYSCSAIAYCSSLASITIPDTVTSIGNECFRGCGSLTSFDSRNVLTIGSNAFTSCSKLTTVILCSSLTSVGASAFNGVMRCTFYCEFSEGAVALSGASISSNCTIVYDYVE